MKKKYLYFLLIFATCISLVWFIQSSSAKYKDKSDLNISITSAKMYFNDDATDVTIPYSNNTANIEFDVQNYLEHNYTLQNINYTVSITNPNYTFSINNNVATNRAVDLTITGGTANLDTLHMVFDRLDTVNVPGTEDVVVTISTNYPYTYSKTFTVTILDGAIEVEGNPTNWTNQDVTLNVVATTQGTTLTEYSFDGGTTWQSNSSKTYTQNTNNIEVYAKDSNGQIIGPVVVDINKIDKTAPTLAFAEDTEYAADGTELQLETLIVTLAEHSSVLTGVTEDDILSGISADGVKCYRNNTEFTTTDFFTNVGRYAVTYKVKDKAGNETTANREILVRWPTGGRYVVKKTQIDGADIAGIGLSSTTSPNGLYKDNASTGANSALPFASKYYYTGPVVDNYLSFAGSTFRILNVSTNDDIKVLGDISDLKLRWGPSYDTSNRKIYLSNTYNTWSTKWWPRGQIYNNETGESKYKLFTATEKAHLDLATFYAGRFNKSDAVDIAYTVYYEQTGGVNLGGDDNPAFQGYSAYPNVSDYLKANKAHDVVINIDDTQDNGVLGIGTTKRDIFNANSWIDMSIDQWTINSKNATDTDNDYWNIDGTTGGRLVSRTYYYEQQYRVVFYLRDDTILSGLGEPTGDGINSGPFTVQENWAWFDSYQVVS